MTSIHLQGILKDSLGEVDVGAIITFTHMTTTGETIAGTKRNLLVSPSGAYSIDVEYGQIRIDYTTRYTERFVSMVIVNQDSTATSLPELLNAAVPATEPVILEMQSILSDAVAAADDSESFAMVSEAFANQMTTSDLIGSVAIFAPGTSILTSGYLSSCDGGSAKWKVTGITGQTASQSPFDLSATLLNDGNGVQWQLCVEDEAISILSLGALVSTNTGGLVVTTFDNGVLIQAAHDRLGDDFGGGRVLLGSGTIGFSSIIYVGDKGPVFLVGTGRGVVQNSKVTFRRSAGTRMQIISGSNTDGVVITSDRANSGLASRQSGGGIIDVMIDGAESGGTGLTVLSHSGSKLKVMLCYWTHIMFNSDVLSNGLAIGPDDVQQFDWSIYTADVNTNNEGIAHVVFNGNGGANTSIGLVSELIIICEANAVAAHFGDCDGITFVHTQTGVRTTASGDAGKIILHADDTLPPAVGVAAGSARSLSFLRLQATEGVTALATITGTFSSERNYIHSYSLGNGAPSPAVEAGAELSWINDSGEVNVRGIVGAIIGNNTNTINEAETRKGTESLRIANSSSNHMILESNDGANIWGVNIDSASGNLRVFRAAGIGELLLGSELIVGDNGIEATNVSVSGFHSVTRSAVTISSGAISPVTGYITVDTEGGAALDDLNTINGGGRGYELRIQSASGARRPTLKDGVGNLALAGDFTLSNPRDSITLIFSDTTNEWIEYSRSDNQ
tara:strand:+ start:180 stop:2381 length:2202 start_codon:yes stop_codon:yes gene_type:complete